ncbi:hypothetical protein DRB96_03195 [Streptomyces sp. ICC1]|nr:hypothetical protein DRB89_04260 [Streptomyces sp. ICC4]AWZ17699.1 hypothetical protein DRB96_03195 [Streptomyces sp. ICC1]
MRAIELSHHCPPSKGAFSVGAVIVDEGGQEIAHGFSRQGGDPLVHAEEAAPARVSITATKASARTGAAVKARDPQSGLQADLPPSRSRPGVADRSAPTPHLRLPGRTAAGATVGAAVRIAAGHPGGKEHPRHRAVVADMTQGHHDRGFPAAQAWRGGARRGAEEAGRTLTDRWDEWAFKLGLWATPAVMGIYGFTWYPTAKDEQGHQIRVGEKLAHPRRPGHPGMPGRVGAEMAAHRGTSGVR